MEINEDWRLATGLTEQQIQRLEDNWHIHMIRRGIRYMCNAFNDEMRLLKNRIIGLERMKLGTHYSKLIEEYKKEISFLEPMYLNRCKKRNEIRALEEQRANAIRSDYKRIVYLNRRCYREFGSLLMEELGTAY